MKCHSLNLSYNGFLGKKIPKTRYEKYQFLCQAFQLQLLELSYDRQ